MHDRFSCIDVDLETLDGRIDCHKVEKNRMLDRLDSLERTINSLVELGTEKDHQIEALQVQVQGMGDCLCQCGEMRQEEEVEHELHDNPPALESTDEELEYADAEESEYHTPPVVPSPILRLIHPELNAFGTTSLLREECPCLGIGWCGEGTNLVASPEENKIPLPVRVSHSELVNPDQGQRATHSIGPIHSLSTIFHLQHPYKPLGSLGPRWEPSITQLVKCKSWRQWAHVPGNHYASVLAGHAPSEGSSSSDRSERGDLGNSDADDDENPGPGGE